MGHAFVHVSKSQIHMLLTCTFGSPFVLWHNGRRRYLSSLLRYRSLRHWNQQTTCGILSCSFLPHLDFLLSRNSFHMGRLLTQTNSMLRDRNFSINRMMMRSVHVSKSQLHMLLTRTFGSPFVLWHNDRRRYLSSLLHYRSLRHWNQQTTWNFIMLSPSPFGFFFRNFFDMGRLLTQTNSKLRDRNFSINQMMMTVEWTHEGVVLLLKS